MRPDRPGTMSRDDDGLGVRDLRHGRSPGAARPRCRYLLHYDEAGDVDGFATYRFKEKFDKEPEGEVRIKEIWAEEPTAYAILVALPARPRPRPHLPPLERPPRRAAAPPRHRRPRRRDVGDRRPLPPRRRRRGRAARPLVRRRRGPGHRGRRPDPARQLGPLPPRHRRRPRAAPRPRSPASTPRPTSPSASSSSGTVYLGGDPAHRPAPRQPRPRAHPGCRLPPPRRPSAGTGCRTAPTCSEAGARATALSPACAAPSWPS